MQNAFHTPQTASFYGIAAPSVVGAAEHVRDCRGQKNERIIIGSERRPETKQGIEGKIVSFTSGRVRDKDCQSEPDRRSEVINFGTC